MVMPAATGKRLSWNGGTEYSAPTAVPNAKSTWISGEKVARTTARPPAPAATATSAHATRGEIRPAAIGEERLVHLVDLDVVDLVDPDDEQVAEQQREHAEQRARGSSCSSSGRYSGASMSARPTPVKQASSVPRIVCGRRGTTRPPRRARLERSRRADGGSGEALGGGIRSSADATATGANLRTCRGAQQRCAERGRARRRRPRGRESQEQRGGDPPPSISSGLEVPRKRAPLRKSRAHVSRALLALLQRAPPRGGSRRACSSSSSCRRHQRSAAASLASSSAAGGGAPRAPSPCCWRSTRTSRA